MVTQRTNGYAKRPRRPGFTLLEMLTVVIIVGLLLAIGTPSVLRMQLIAMRRTSLVRIRTLETGCEAYKKDFGMFPPSGSASNGIGKTACPQGQHNLARCLVGYRDDDGKAGLGFRIGKSKVYGPYAGCEDVKYTPAGSEVVFLDAFDYPILYYCGMEFNANGDYVFVSFKDGDNSNGPDSINTSYVQVKNAENVTVKARKDFILCSKGPDGKWPHEAKVPEDFESTQAALDQRDDITNFLD